MPTDPINTLNNNINILNNNINILNKFLNKTEKLQNDIKIQQNQQDQQKKEYELLHQHINQMNILLKELNILMGTNINVTTGQKPIPFHTGPVTVGTILLTQPANPDDYTEKINVYMQNNSSRIPHMTLVNDGPGDIYFIMSQSQDQFNTKEGLLHPNDQRELFNVYEIRLRVTQPLTSFRLIEGIFRTGSFAPNTVSNITIRPTVQSNEFLKDFTLQFDSDVPITINVPTVQNFPVLPGLLGLINQPPLPPGQTAALVDSTTGSPMPYNIPEGCIFETFATVANFSTDYTIRSYFEFIPGFYTRVPTFPADNRGMPVNEVLNLSFYSSEGFDPAGAPAGGKNVLITVTNDDPFNNMTGDVDFVAIVRRLS